MKVTVLMPVFNAESFLNESIQSILNQSFKDFKFLIIDDGSYDNSNNIIKNYLSDPRVTLISLPKNKGLIYALNLGLENINSDYMIRMDADDISHIDRFKLLFEFMEENPDIAICGTEVGVFENKLEKEISNVSDYEIKARHLFNCSITHASAIYRLSLFKKLKLKYNSEFPHSEDNCLITDILLNSKASILKCKLYWVRKHENQVSKLYRDIQIESSSKKRFELLLFQFNVKLTCCEKKIYTAISYKKNNLELSDFDCLIIFLNKIIHLEGSNLSYDYDRDLFKTILFKRISLLYMLNYKLGIGLFKSYSRIYFGGFDLKIGFRLFIKVLFYKIRLIS